MPSTGFPRTIERNHDMTSPNTQNRRRAPAGLSTRGRAFWRSSVTEYELSDGEMLILEEAARCLDRLDLLSGVISELGPMVYGSQGQQVVNPAMAEARGQQATLHRLVSALKMPDSGGEAMPSGRSIAGSTAATARWSATKRQAGNG
jgi:hypothetical protein